MRILISGGTGFIGQALCKYFIAQGDEIIIISRHPEKYKKNFQDSVHWIEWSQLDTLAPVDVIINLAGENLFSGLFTSARKEKIISSRLESTRALAKFAQKQQQALIFLSASGIHRYPSDDICYTEKTLLPTQAKTFMAQLAQNWEQEALLCASQHCRVVTFRLGVVLDPSGGMLAQTLPFARYSLGSIFGSGQQPFPWVALEDVISALDFIIQTPSLIGPVNLIVPQEIKQAEFSKQLAQKLNAYCFLKFPGFALKALFGDLADELLLNGPHAMPEKLLDAGFKFKYPNFNEFLSKLKF